MKITAAIAREAHQPFSIEEIDLDGPKDGEILVKISAVGLCHSDLLVIEQVLPVPLPAVLGHEGAGIVEAVGAGVTKVKAGDRVVLTYNSCGTCKNCVDGEPAYCLNFMPLNYAGTRADGSHALCKGGHAISANFFGQSSFASYALANERNVVKVEGDTPLEILAPFGCGIQTGAGTVMRALAAKAGSSIVVFGGGPVGLSAVLGAVVQGCKTIILVEPHEARRSLGLELGATHAIDPKAGDVAAAVSAIVEGGVTYVVETSGAVAAFEVSTKCLASRGTLALVGVPGNPATALSLNVIEMLVKGLTVTAVVEGDSIPDDFIPELAALHKAGRFPVEKMVKTYPFADINQAIADQSAGACVKVVLVF